MECGDPNSPSIRTLITQLQGNVLLNAEGKACLTDFGLSSIKAEFEGTSYWSSTVGGAIRWRATELFENEPVLTKECDIYSFGCIMMQVSIVPASLQKFFC